MDDYTMGEMDHTEYAPEMGEEEYVCPVCIGKGCVDGPPWHPCPRCASDRMRGEMHKGNKDTAYKVIMPEIGG